jgi:predicted amidophosphoribosyltransferase
MQGGTVQICYRCASEEMADLPTPRCMICDSSLEEDGRCRNKVCNWSETVRGFDVVYAISMNTGRLRNAIHRYKYRDRYGWRLIFGRVLAGYLEENDGVFEDYNAIIPAPTFVGPEGRPRDHIAEILEWAEIESTRSWPFEYSLIEKTRATRSMVSAPSWDERLWIAQTELRQALHVPAAAQVRDRRILVFDDVFTGGHTLSEVARTLRISGARQVSGLVLARQPWG